MYRGSPVFVRLMKPEFDREVDALLRRAAARSGNASTHGAGSHPASRVDEAQLASASSHLDADERAAFAEGALPAPARAAYVSHLADCKECRRAVAGLASAAGVSVMLEQSAAASAASDASAVTVATEKGRDGGWFDWFGALFAPRVLRFVAPALALCLVGVVAYVALRSGDGGETQTARHEAGSPFIQPEGVESEDGIAAATSDGMTANMNSSVGGEAGTSTAGSNANSAGIAGGVGASTAGGGRETAEASATQTGRGPVAAPKEDALSPAELSVVARAPETPRESAAAAPAPAQPRESSREETSRQDAESSRNISNAERDETSNERAGRSRNYDLQQQQFPDGSRNRAGAGMEMRGANAAPPPPAASSPSDSAKSENRPAAKGRAARGASTDENRDGAETRAVEGRRFRRTSGVWVDENFRDSLPTTTLRRNSTAYRELIAEMPEVGRIAERLTGEVVIVVRGRAYRIKP